MTPVRLEPAALRSRVKHSTTEPLCSPWKFCVWFMLCDEFLSVLSSFAIILLKERELVVLLLLCSGCCAECLCSVSLPLGAVGLSDNVTYHGHTHLFFKSARLIDQSEHHFQNRFDSLSLTLYLIDSF